MSIKTNHQRVFLGCLVFAASVSVVHPQTITSSKALNIAVKNAKTAEDGAHVTVQQKPIHPMPIQVDVNMVVVNVTVTGSHDRIVAELDPSAFEIYDDKVPQRIAAFSTEDAPISVGMIFDSSGSMADKIERSKEAALQFFKTCNTQDEFMLITFSESPALVGGFTSNSETLQDRLIAAQAGGTTALLDAIYIGLEKMRSATRNRKALLVISDGGDNHSRYTEGDLRRAVQESDVEIRGGSIRAVAHAAPHAGGGQWTEIAR